MKTREFVNIFFLMLMVFLGLYVNTIFIYFLFLGLVVNKLYKNGLTKKSLWECAILSVIVPDNYSTIVCIIIAAGYQFVRDGLKIRKNRESLFVGILFLEVLLTTILHGVPLVNILFALIYFSSIFIFLMFDFDRDFSSKIDEYTCTLHSVLKIEMIALLINFTQLLLGIKSGDDWSTGTFGIAQQSQLYIVFFFYFVVLIDKLMNGKLSTRKDKILIIACFVGMGSTQCWSLFGITMVICLLFLVAKIDKKMIKRIGLIVFSVLVVFLCFGNQLLNSHKGEMIYRILSDSSYRTYRVAKIQNYVDAFYTIPSEDTLYLLFGNGIGWYASRGALTCTGEYVDSYTKIFNESMSDYTRYYIYPSLSYAKLNSNTDYGSVLSRPYSSAIALMGETGMVGCILCLFILISKTKGKGYGYKMILASWLGMCFLENYFEYSKVIIMLAFCLCLLDKKTDIRRSKVEKNIIR